MPNNATAKTASALKRRLAELGWLWLPLGLLASGLVMLATQPQPQKCLFTIRTDQGRQCVYLEVADNQAEREHGLSDRESIPLNRGMLFEFDQPGRQCMWMKDMHFDLDMIWLDETGKVTNVVEGATPGSFPHTFCGTGKYVIEVSAGVYKLSGLVWLRSQLKV